MGETVLRCERCGNEGEPGFDATKLYVHKVVLDGEGLVEQARIQCDVEGSEEELACRRCGEPVEFAPAGPGAEPIPAGEAEEKMGYESWLRRVLAGLGDGGYPEAATPAVLERSLLALLLPAGEESGGLPTYVAREPDTRGGEARARRLLEALYSPLWPAGEGIVYAHVEDGEGTVLVVDLGGEGGRGPARLIRHLCVGLPELAVEDAAGLRRLYEDVRRHRDAGDAAWPA